MSELSPNISPTRPRRFKPYPNYRDSRVEWLGKVPEHWTIAPLYGRYDIALGKMLDANRISGEHLRPYLRNVDVQWDRINVSDLPEMDFDTADSIRYSLRSGDLLVCEGGEVGRTAVWSGELQECYYQKALHRLRPYADSEIPRFFFYAMYASADAGRFTAGTNPNTIDHLTAVQLSRYRFAFPPLHEQRIIANFLDREAAKIDALVAKKERLIVLLQEKRTALITRAVTKGLDTNVHMKSSGIEWFGEIPAHWRLMKMKHACERVFVGIAEAATFAYVDDGVPMLRSTDVRANRIRTDDIRRVDRRFAGRLSSKQLRTGDIVTVRTGNAGVSAVVPAEYDGGQCFTLVVSRLAAVHDGRYFCYCLNALPGQHQFAVEGVGTAQVNISVPIVQNTIVGVPSPDEQKRVVASIEQEVARGDALMKKIREGVDRLKEFRTAVISAAVTGKIDVREEVT